MFSASTAAGSAICLHPPARRDSRHLALLYLILLPALTVAPAAQAASDEIQVYTEEMDEPGEFGLELHLNYVPKGRREAGYAGEMPSDRRLQITPEFSYGLTRSLEAGLYLPVAVDRDQQLYGNGVRFRLKYIAPREEGAANGDGGGFFWGVNMEYGFSARRISQSQTGLELRPIIGYRTPNWLVSFNPILDTDLSGNDRYKPNFEPALKLTRTLREGVAAGFEYYGEYGPTRKLLPEQARTHYLYGVVDVDFKGFDMNFGIGRGLRNAEDEWIIKAIIAFPFR